MYPIRRKIRIRTRLKAIRRFLKKTRDRFVRKVLGIKVAPPVHPIPYIDYLYLIQKYMHESKYPEYLCDWYREKTGKKLDLNHPVTFNEKLQWLKLYDNLPIKTRLTDKFLVRDWVTEKTGAEHLIPLLGVWDSFDEIDFDRLPNQFVLKANHGSDWNIIVKDKSILNKVSAKQKFDKWMTTNYAFMGGISLYYKDIPPKIIAEQYMGDLLDYKFLCFHGEPKYVWIDAGRYSEHKRNIYDLDWNLQEFIIMYPNGAPVEKPANLPEMIAVAKTLSKDFLHVRVDLYAINNKVYFGEMTFVSGGGGEKFIPEEADKKLGDLLRLPVG